MITWPRVVWLLAVLTAIVLTAMATVSAYSVSGQRFASLFIDPFGGYSEVQLPTWGLPSKDPKLAPVCRLVGIDGKKIEAKQPAAVSRELTDHIKNLPPEAEYVQLLFDGVGCPERTLPLRIRKLGLTEVLFFFVIYALVAWMVLWSGGLVFILCGRPSAGRAYLFWSSASFVFLMTFYDYHTRTALAPLFLVSTLAVPTSALWLAYGFPDPPRRGRRWMRGVMVALTLLAGAAALWLVLGIFVDGGQRALRSHLDMVLGPSIGALGLSVLVRMKGSTGRSRAELLTAIWGLALTPLLIVLLLLITMVTDKDYMHVALPFVVALFPLSIGYALIRNNILATEAILTPGMLMVPIAFLGLTLAVLGGYATHWALQHQGGTISLPILVGIALFAFLLNISQRAVIRLFFPAALQFRPTIERLSDQLAALSDIAAIRGTVDGVVAQWLPTLSARILSLESLSEVPHLPSDCREKLSHGERVWTRESPWHRSLLIPMKSLGELHGFLSVGPKRGAALYTQEDIDLLETIASLGAMALHHARTLEEVERLQKLEVDILRGEKEQALGALSAEICHEVVYPLNFLRDLLRQAAREPPTKVDNIEMGHDEIGRLERMISSLRMLDPPAPRRELILLAPLIQRALHLIRELIHQKRITATLELTPDLKRVGDPDLVVQLFVNLLRNAAQAVGDGGAIGVRDFEREGDRFIDVWDTGPGLPEAVSKVLFTRRVTTKEGGQGIGLRVAARIANGFKWQLTFERESNRTCFRVQLPPSPTHPSRHEET